MSFSKNVIQRFSRRWAPGIPYFMTAYRASDTGLGAKFGDSSGGPDTTGKSDVLYAAGRRGSPATRLRK